MAISLLFLKVFFEALRDMLDAPVCQWNVMFDLDRNFLLKLQCTRQELEEMLAICVYMGGGPALMYSAEALSAFDQLAQETPRA